MEVSDSESAIIFATENTVTPFWAFLAAGQLSFRHIRAIFYCNRDTFAKTEEINKIIEPVDDAFKHHTEFVHLVLLWTKQNNKA